MTKMNPILEVKDLSLTYKTRKGFLKYFSHTAIKNISFELEKGETLGILGRNGVGKSTLLRILAGIVNPTSGTIKCDKDTTRALLTLGLGFMPQISGRENAMYSAMLQGATKSKAKSILKSVEEFSELGEFFDQPVDTYSSGMRARLGFATALITEVDILFIDEVLSVGDAHFRKKAEAAMLEKINSDQTVVLVTHSSDQINKICSRALWINEGIIQAEGDAPTVAHQYNLFMQNIDSQNQ